MKRDDDLLREMLLEFESQEDWLILVPETLGTSKEDRRKSGHVRLLCDAKLLTQVGNGTFRLTNDGYDYLEAIRSNKAWEKTKKGAQEIGGMTLGMMKDLAVSYLKQEASEKLGIKF